MDDLAEAAGLARRTLYNQFTSKEEIFREMLLEKCRGILRTHFRPAWKRKAMSTRCYAWSRA